MTLIAHKIGRLSGVDAVKCIAAVAVIFIHLLPATPLVTKVCDFLNYCAVPFFFCISLVFIWQKYFSGNSISVKSVRWDRILVPYCTWSLGYYVLRVIKSSLSGELEFPDPLGCLFYGDSAAQLYFIPLLVVYQLIAVSFISALRSRKLIWLCICVVVVSYIYINYGANKGYWAFKGAFERGVLYIAVSLILAKIQQLQFKRIPLIILFSSGLIVILCAVGIFQFEFGVLRGPLIGIAISGVALNWSLSLNSSKIKWILSCSYGIYLSHFLFIAVFEQINKRLTLGAVPYTLSGKVMIGTFVALMCLGLIKILRTNSLLSYFFLGEGSKLTSTVRS